MNRALMLLSVSGLALTFVPSILYFVQTTDLTTAQHLMTLGMVLWFTGDLARVFRRNTTP